MPNAAPAATIPALVAHAASTFGDQTFLEDNTISLSFAEFDQQCQQVAGALIKLGIEKGDRIGVWAPNCAEWVLAAIGAQIAGAVLVTLNTRYKGSEAAYILRKSRAKALFSIGNFLDVDYPAQLANEDLPDLQHTIVFPESAKEGTKPGATEVPHLPWQALFNAEQQASADDVAARRQTVGADDTSDILFTSGTTGSPKGVMTAHGQNLQAFTTFSNILGLEAGDRYLVINPFFHSFGYKAGILACLTKGVTLLPHAVFDAELVLKRIAADKISVLPGPPTLFQSLLARPDLADYDISSLKRATTGAAVIPVEMIHKMKSELGFETVITAYGLTESCGLVTMCRHGDSAEIIATTSGRAIPGVELRCVDSNNQEVARGEAGEIVFRGFNIMKGYFENESATQETIDNDGWLHTGDVGIMDADGNLKITDRLKDMFITGGFNCYPAEIEKTLARHDAIAMCAVIGIPDERMGEVAMAFVVLKPNATLDEATLRQWCKDNMANYKVPRRCAFVESLPLNASGKVVKPELKVIAKDLI